MAIFETDDFAIELPEGWSGRVEEAPPVDALAETGTPPSPPGETAEPIPVIAGPEVRGIPVKITIAVDRAPPEVSIEEYAQLYLATVAPNMPGYLLLREGPAERPDGLPAWDAVYRWTPVSPGADPRVFEALPPRLRKLFQRMYLVLGAGKALVLNATLTKPMHKLYADELAEIFRRFNLKPGAVPSPTPPP